MALNFCLCCGAQEPSWWIHSSNFISSPSSFQKHGHSQSTPPPKISKDAFTIQVFDFLKWFLGMMSAQSYIIPSAISPCKANLCWEEMRQGAIGGEGGCKRRYSSQYKERAWGPTGSWEDRDLQFSTQLLSGLVNSHDRSGLDRVGGANLGVIETKNVGPKYF